MRSGKRSIEMSNDAEDPDKFSKKRRVDPVAYWVRPMFVLCLFFFAVFFLVQVQANLDYYENALVPLNSSGVFNVTGPICTNKYTFLWYTNNILLPPIALLFWILLFLYFLTLAKDVKSYHCVFNFWAVVTAIMIIITIVALSMEYVRCNDDYSPFTDTSGAGNVCNDPHWCCLAQNRNYTCCPNFGDPTLVCTDIHTRDDLKLSPVFLAVFAAVVIEGIIVLATFWSSFHTRKIAYQKVIDQDGNEMYVQK